MRCHRRRRRLFYGSLHDERTYIGGPDFPTPHCDVGGSAPFGEVAVGAGGLAGEAFAEGLNGVSAGAVPLLIEEPPVIEEPTCNGNCNRNNCSRERDFSNRVSRLGLLCRFPRGICG